MKTEIKSISKSFGKKNVLNSISFSAEGGECIGILGKNGSGKSTLFSVLTGLQKGDGEFLCDGIDLLCDAKSRNRIIGFVPQSPPLIEELSAKDNLMLWYKSDALKSSLKDGNLKMLGIDEFIKLPVSKMSGGMKKRLAIGCSIANDPPVLLLDEPTSALDLVCKEKIYSYLNRHKARGGTVIIATHDIYELGLCDTVYLLKNGTLSLYDSPCELKDLIGRLNDD